MADATIANIIQKAQGGSTWLVKSGGTATFESGSTLAIATGATFTGRHLKNVAKSVWFNIDNGAGTTIDDVITMPSFAITITAARICYVDATTGTVAAGNVKIGTTLGGAEIVAATAYENSKAVGTATAMTIVAGAVAANGSVFVRHTGVAATAAGQAFVEIEYTID